MATITPNYYETLEISRNANQEEIKEAYRNLSLRFLPSRASDINKSVYEFKFHQIAEAFLVLSDPFKKGVYDNYGKEGLYNGIRDKNGEIKGAFKYTGNAMEVFNDYMNNTNPFSLIRETERIDDEYGSIFGSANGGMNQREKSPLKNIEIELPITLDEFYNGCIKQVKYKKNALNLDKRTSNIKECEISVQIFPGYSKETILTFPLQGQEAPGMQSSDLIIFLKEVPHKDYKRVNKNDLILTKTITLSQALNSVPVEVNTLDGRKLCISMDEIISPKTVKVVKGEGMPICDNENQVESLVFDNKKGDLYIIFNIKFPDYINSKKKEKIIKLLTEK